MPQEVITDNALHNAFPSLALTKGNNLLLFYRVASSHDNSLGKIVKKTSGDNGESWSEETTVLANAAHDYRTAQVRKLSDGKLLLSMTVTYYPYTNPWTGFSAAYLSSNGGVSWAGPYDQPSGWAGGTFLEGPPCELQDGRILQTTYGWYSGESINSVSIIESLDGGVTWGNEKSIHYQGAFSFIPGGGCNESVLVRLAGGKLLVLMRGENETDIYSVFCSDGRRWSQTRHAFAGSGKPHFTQLPNGTLRAIYRAGDGTGQMMMRESYDFGETWSAEHLQTRARMVYADSAILNDGRQLMVYATESAATKAEIRSYDFDPE